MPTLFLPPNLNNLTFYKTYDNEREGNKKLFKKKKKPKENFNAWTY
jgi:hypothetical protein